MARVIVPRDENVLQRHRKRTAIVWPRKDTDWLVRGRTGSGGSNHNETAGAMFASPYDLIYSSLAHWLQQRFVFDSTIGRLSFDNHSTAIRPRHDQKKTNVTTVLHYRKSHIIIMRPSSLGGTALCVALCLSVCLSVRPSVRPSRYRSFRPR